MDELQEGQSYMNQKHVILIIYTTQHGRTGAMVEPVQEGIEEMGVLSQVRRVEDVRWDEMVAADGIIVGTPVRFGDVDWQIKRLFDVTAFQDYPGPLAGKVGGAFTAGSRPGSGAELALLSMIHILLNHGMVIQGNANGSHYGPVSLRETSRQHMEEACRDWGRHCANLVKRLQSQP